MNKYVQTILGTYFGIKLLRILFSFLVVCVLVFAVLFVAHDSTEQAHKVATTGMTIRSPDFTDGGILPVAYTCEGAGSLPPLTIESIPASAKVLQIDFVELDTGAALVKHWIAWNIPVKNRTVSTADLGDGTIIGINSFSKTDYTAPCHDNAHSTAHRYKFRVTAHSKSIPLSSPEDSSELYGYQNNVVAKSEFTINY